MNTERSWLLDAVLTAWSCLNLAELEEAEKAYEAEDYEATFKLSMPLAEQGLAEMQLNLGLGTGDGLPQEYNDSISLYRLAADTADDLPIYVEFVTFVSSTDFVIWRGRTVS